LEPVITDGVTVSTTPNPGRVAELRAAAAGACTSLVDNFTTIEGICLFGSVARGDAGRDSDIDLLVVGTDETLTPAVLRGAVSRETRRRLALSYHSVGPFEAYCRSGRLFPIHLAKEGVILYDPGARLKAALAAVSLPHVPRELDRHLDRLKVVEDRGKFDEDLLFCFYHLYVLSASVAMLVLAGTGIYEFNRDRAFARLEGLLPKRAHAIQELRALRPFYAQVKDRERERQPLPFPSRGSQTQLESALAAAREIAR
jgi:hypothetical protein